MRIRHASLMLILALGGPAAAKRKPATTDAPPAAETAPAAAPPAPPPAARVEPVNIAPPAIVVAPAPVAVALVEECVLPAQVSAVDPIRSGIIPGAAPELSPPQLDVLGASLQWNADGAAVAAVMAPAAIGTTRHIPVISDLRVGVYGRDNFQRIGGSLTLGWDSGSRRLTNQRADRAPGPCTAAVERALLAARFHRAYRNRVVVGARGSAELLPVVSGPKVIDPTSMAMVDVQPERFGGYSGTAHVGWFLDRRFGLWVVGGVAGSRAVHGVRGVNLRGGAGLDVAYQLGLGSLRSDGFQPGITFGAYGRYAKCASDGGCDQDLHGYPGGPIVFDSVIVVGAYVDFRLSNLLQLRLACPTNYWVLAAAPAASAGGANIVEVVPTISVNLASWGL